MENDDKIHVYSEEVRDILSEPPKTIIKIGNTIVFVFVFILAVLSYIIKYPDLVVGEAILTTTNPPEKIYARATGRLDSIFVKDDNSVKDGQALAIIESSADFNSVKYLKSVLDTLNLQKLQPNFPYDLFNDLKLGDISVDYATFENDLRNYQQLLLLRPYLIESEYQKNELFQQQKRFSYLKNQLTITLEELELEKAKLNRNEKLFKKGVISKQTLEEVELLYLQKQKTISSIRNQVSQLESNILDLKTNQKNTIIDQTKDEINLYRNLLNSFNQLKRTIRNWEMQYVLESSIDGRLDYINYWRSSQFINQGELVFSVIPEKTGNYIVRSRIPSLNTGKLTIGQKANIRLSNYPDREFGILEGMLSSISKVPDTDGFIVLEINLPNQLTTSFGKELDFKQEMTGTVEIITEDLRLIERLLYQFRDLLRRSDRPFIDKKN